MSVAVDPDALLRLFRRVSYRSALTASLATRLVPVLARDAARMSEAARCRPQPRRAGWRWRAPRWPGRSTAPWTWPRRSSCAATRSAGRPARRPRAVVAPRHPRRRGRRRLIVRAGGGRPDRRRGRGGALPARSSIELGAGRAGAGRRDRRCSPRRRSPGARARLGVAACLSRSCAPSASPTPTRRRRAGAARREPRRSSRARFTVLAGRLGLGQVDAAARALRPRAALPRRRRRPASSTVAGHERARPRPGRAGRACAARCSRTPSPRW